MSQEHKESRELVNNTLIFGFGTVVSKVIMFILLPIYTIYLSKSELGEGELVVNFMNLIYPIATINIISALLRYSMDELVSPKKVLQNTIIVTILGIIIASILIFIININSSISNWKIYLCSLLLCYSITQIFSVFSKALNKIKEFAIGNILYTMMLLVLTFVFLVIFNLKTSGYLLAIIISNIITFIYFFFKLDLKKYITFEKIDKKLLIEMVCFSIPLIINSISWWLTTFCDRFVIEQYLGTAAVGLYSVSSKIPTIVSTIAAIFMQAWVLSAIKAYQNNKNYFFDDIFKKFSVLFLTWAAIIIAISKILMSILIGSSFSSSFEFVPYLICASIFMGFGNFFAALYTSAKKNTSIMLTTIIGALINIILNFMLIPKIGIQGAVYATMISQIIVMAYRMIDSRRFIKFKLNLLRLLLVFSLIVLESYVVINPNYYYFGFVIMIIVITIYHKDLINLAKFGKEYIKGVLRNVKKSKN